MSISEVTFEFEYKPLEGANSGVFVTVADSYSDRVRNRTTELLNARRLESHKGVRHKPSSTSSMRSSDSPLTFALRQKTQSANGSIQKPMMGCPDTGRE